MMNQLNNAFNSIKSFDYHTVSNTVKEKISNISPENQKIIAIASLILSSVALVGFILHRCCFKAKAQVKEVQLHLPYCGDITSIKRDYKLDDRVDLIDDYSLDLPDHSVNYYGYDYDNYRDIPSVGEQPFVLRRLEEIRPLMVSPPQPKLQPFCPEEAARKLNIFLNEIQNEVNSALNGKRNDSDEVEFEPISMDTTNPWMDTTINFQ